MNESKGITVYCASSATLDQIYHRDAAEVGTAIAAAGVPLVYGGGRSGLMGEVADAVLKAGGTAIGIIPRFMQERGWQHTGLSQLVVVHGMHTRKATMMNMARGIIALPGGIGTFEELFEAITWRQLGLFQGNIVILNTAGYYNAMLEMLENAINQGFMRPDHAKLYTVATSPAQAVALALTDSDALHLSPKF